MNSLHIKHHLENQLERRQIHINAVETFLQALAPMCVIVADEDTSARLMALRDFEICLVPKVNLVVDYPCIGVF